MSIDNTCKRIKITITTIAKKNTITKTITTVILINSGAGEVV